MEKLKKQKERDESRFWQELKAWGIVLLIALGLKATIIEAYQVPTGSMERTILIGDFLLGNKFIYGTRTPNWIGIPWTKIGFHIPWFRLPAFRKPKQNDIVIFKYPNDPMLNYIKRCVAGPGQVVEIKDKVLYVDGKIFKNPEYSQFTQRNTYSKNRQDPGIFPRTAGNKDNYSPVYVPAEGDTLWYGKLHPQVIQNVVELAHHDFRINRGRMYIDNMPSDYYVVEQDHYFMMGDNRDNSSDSRFWGFVPYNLVLGKGLIIYLSWNKESKQFYRIYEKIRWNRIGKIVS